MKFPNQSITRVTVNGRTYRRIIARVPFVAGGYKIKAFNCRKDETIRATKNRAFEWQIKMGCIEWGAARFTAITERDIPVRTLHCPNFAVRIRKITLKRATGESYDQSIEVAWRDLKGFRKAKKFNLEKLGGYRQASHAASLYAAKVKAEITGGELNLPPFEFDLN